MNEVPLNRGYLKLGMSPAFAALAKNYLLASIRTELLCTSMTQRG